VTAFSGRRVNSGINATKTRRHEEETDTFRQEQPQRAQRPQRKPGIFFVRFVAFVVGDMRLNARILPPPKGL
jgi:hypothetical protein